MNHDAAWHFAVDFGTTATTAAVAVGDGQIELLQLERDSNRMPSAVFLERSGKLAVGRRAVNQALTAPGRFEPTPKRHVGHSHLPLGGERLETTEVVAAVFARVLLEALRQRGSAPASVVLTHPVGWGPARVNVLAEALARAGERVAALGDDEVLPAAVSAAARALPEPVLVPEPVGAAFHFADSYGLSPGDSLAVYDLGGGTFDTAVVLRTSAGGFEILANGGLDDLGGEDFDAALLRLVGERSLAPEHPVRWAALLGAEGDEQAARDRRRLLEHVQQAKEDLSTQTRTEVRLLDDPEVETVLRREELDAVVEPHLRRSLEELAGTIEAAGLTPAGLAGVFLVGGSSRLPLVASLVEGAIGRPATTLDDPKAVVVRGALLAARQRTAAEAEAALERVSGARAAGPAEPTAADSARPAGPARDAAGAAAQGGTPWATRLTTAPIPHYMWMSQLRPSASGEKHSAKVVLQRDRSEVIVRKVATMPDSLAAMDKGAESSLKGRSGYVSLGYEEFEPHPSYGVRWAQRTYRDDRSPDRRVERYVIVSKHSCYYMAAAESEAWVLDTVHIAPDPPWPSKALSRNRSPFALVCEVVVPEGWIARENLVIWPPGGGLNVWSAKVVVGAEQRWIDEIKGWRADAFRTPLAHSEPGTFLGGHPCEIATYREKGGTLASVMAVGVVDGRGYRVTSEAKTVEGGLKDVTSLVLLRG